MPPTTTSPARVRTKHDLPAAVALTMSLLAGCAEPSPQLTGAALAARRAETRREVERALTEPAGALLGDESYVLRDPGLLASATAEVLERCEPWMAGDAERLRFFLQGHAADARRRLLTSDAGRRELERLVAARFAAPRVERRVVSVAGRAPGAADRALAHFGGLLLSGRSTAPLPVPPHEYVEVVADFGILPSALEANERGQHNTLPVRFVRGANPWLDPDDPARPAGSVTARLLLDLAATAPEASRLAVRMAVLPALGPARSWEASAERESDRGDGIVVTLGRRESGMNDARSESLSLRGLAARAAGAPRVPAAASR